MVHDCVVSAIGAIGRWTSRLVVLAVGGVIAGVTLLALYLLVAYLRLPDVGTLGDAGDPGETAFMKEDTCERIDRRYRPLGRIDPTVVCAMVLAEDIRFFSHDGVDWDALREAAAAAWNTGDARFGASTIPMQLARNLYLARSRVPSRKLREIVLARRLVDRFDRRRLLEVYVNSVELAPCVYGVEAGAHHYFGHGAGHLDLAEATLLASVLPRPASAPGTRGGDRIRMQSKQRRLIGGLGASRLISAQQRRIALREVVRMWHVGWKHHTPASDGPAPTNWVDRACGTGRNP